MEIYDLRSAIEYLKSLPGQIVETDVEVDTEAELSGVYRYVGAGGTVMRPTKTEGPAMLFHNVKGYPEASVLIGLLAFRSRAAALLGEKKENVGRLLRDCAANPIQPIVSEETAPCQELVHFASEPDFNLFDLIPAPTNTSLGCGPLYYHRNVLCHPPGYGPVRCRYPPPVYSRS